mmetsp:Transcript_25519/g.31435  ORF Transcript_25519/g.31435 Transcript_25519/m.31435 type:complete len:325 (-) Transcript_25519:1161-2135(-)
MIDYHHSNILVMMISISFMNHYYHFGFLFIFIFLHRISLSRSFLLHQHQPHHHYQDNIQISTSSSSVRIATASTRRCISINSCSERIPSTTPCYFKHLKPNKVTQTTLYASRRKNNNKTDDATKKKKTKKLPKLIIFDLDGCLWKPEMYELLYFSNGKGSPFTRDEYNPNLLRSVGGEPIQLLGNVRNVMNELQYDEKWWNTKIGISSRTDEPNWARELLDKFIIDEEDGDEKYPPFPLQQIFTKEICELAHDSKVNHFERILKNSPGRPKYEDCLFFDNELGNCRQIAKLGVTVCYCPHGVTQDAWDLAVSNFPNSNGKVIGK